MKLDTALGLVHEAIEASGSEGMTVVPSEALDTVVNFAVTATSVVRFVESEAFHSRLVVRPVALPSYLACIEAIGRQANG